MNLDNNLHAFLERLNNSVKRKVTVVLIGGNVLTILGVKKVTKDIDVVYRCIHPEVGKFCQEYMAKYKYKVHCFVDGLFQAMRIKDYLQKAMPFELPQFPNLEVKLLNIYDVILTKVNRWYPEDQKDISDILSLMEISEFELDKRFKYLLKYYMGQKDDLIRHYGEFKQALGNKLHS